MLRLLLRHHFHCLLLCAVWATPCLASPWSTLTANQNPSPPWSKLTYSKPHDAATFYCPFLYPSPPRSPSQFSGFQRVSTGPECRNETLYLLYNREGQTLVERSSTWVKKVIWYLSGRNQTILQRMPQTASKPSDGNVQISVEDAKIFGAHMVPKQTKLLRFVVNDGTRYQMCVMKLESWAHVFRDYSVSFQVRLTFTEANNQTYTFCTHPNLIV